MLLIKRNKKVLTECLDNGYLCMMTIVMSIGNIKQLENNKLFVQYINFIMLVRKATFCNMFYVSTVDLITVTNAIVRQLGKVAFLDMYNP